MLIDVLVLLFLVVAVKLIPPLNRRFAALWQRSVIGKLLVIVVAFLAVAQTSGFLEETDICTEAEYWCKHIRLVGSPALRR